MEGVVHLTQENGGMCPDGKKDEAPRFAAILVNPLLRQQFANLKLKISSAGPTTLKVKITGLTPGKHGFHVVS